jgi:hypothetical protein
VPFGSYSGVLIFYASAECLLRLAAVGTIILIGDNKTPSRRRAEASSGKRSNQAPLSLDHLEETMITRLAAIALTILFAAMSLAGPAEAGASASAPSKNTRASQLAAQQAQTGHKTAKNDFGITEYSSSSARNH